MHNPPAITAATCLYCVLGNPVAHSLSPVMHTRAFADMGVDAVYLAFAPRDIGAAVAAIRTLNIRGASVTLPFKEQVMAHLDAVDEPARAMGAVNTIVNHKGHLTGYNTDSHAATDPLLPHGIAGRTVLVIGAGGAARAVAFGICHHKGDLIITSRNPRKGRDLARSFGGRFADPADISSLTPDILINTTPLGMAPRLAHDLPCPESLLHPPCVVMDVVYTPPDTRLIQTARERGCTTIDGLAMFVAQGAAQFHLWTGIRPDMEQMRRTVLDHLAQQTP